MNPSMTSPTFWVVSSLLSARIALPLCAADPLTSDLARDHPRPSYHQVEEIQAMAEAVRTRPFSIHRGAWEWDRLLTRYLDGGRTETNALPILEAYFQSILDRGGAEGRYPTFFSGHGAWGSGGRLRIYQELVRQNRLTPAQQQQFKNIIGEALEHSFDYPRIERSANNRPFGMNGGPAIALTLFPDLPQAPPHRRWLEALWRELKEYGDTTEANYFPYGPIYLDGLLDMAEGLGKFETEGDFLSSHANRYLDYIHGGGVRGNPNSASWVTRDRSRVYSDPWNSAYYNGTHPDAHVWYRLAKRFRSPEFLWASEQASLGGRPPHHRDLPEEYLEAYRQRYAWFDSKGINPRPPKGGTKIGYLSPLKHRVPERLFLTPNRESGQPFASFYLYDRNNNYMHYNDDVMGQLYEYAFDGSKFLHTSGKYNSNVMKTPASYDALWVQHPATDFATGRAGEIPLGTWKTASMPLQGLLNHRRGPDSPRWKFDASIGLFRRRDDPHRGYAHGNMDGYWYLNDDFRLESMKWDMIDPVLEMGIPRLSGPKGDLPLFDAWTEAPEQFTITTQPEGERPQLVWKGGDPPNSVVAFIDGPQGQALRITGKIGQPYSIRLEAIGLTFNVSEDYTRLLLDHNGRITSGGEGFGTRGGHQAGFLVNKRMAYLTYDTRGGILERPSLRAEQRGNDSFGQFRYRSYAGPRSFWTRQTLLTQEGYLIVRDSFSADETLRGYLAGPCWLLRPEENWKEDGRPDRGPLEHDPKRNWFEAPAWDHAWWQTRPKRILVWIHPAPETTFGITAHATSADISRQMGFEDYPTQNSHAKSRVRTGETMDFLSVLVPFDPSRTATDVIKGITTTVNPAGDCQATIGSVTVSINRSGDWATRR